MRLTTTPLSKIKNDEKSDKDCVKIKFHRYPTSKKSDLYKIKLALFDDGKPEEFLLFIRNFNMTLEASGMLVYITNIQYFCMMLWRRVTSVWHVVCWGGKYNQRKFKPLYLGFRNVLSTINVLSKQKRVMCCGTRNPRKLRVICYAARLIDLDEYLETFPGLKESGKIVKRNWMKFCWTLW